MRIKYVIYLQVLSFLKALSVQQSGHNITYEVAEMEIHCRAYCISFLKPILENDAATKNKIKNYDSIIHDKDEQIEKLNKELAVLQSNVTSYKEIEIMCNEHIKEIFRMIGVLEQKTCPADKNAIATPEAKVDEKLKQVQCVNKENSDVINYVNLPKIGQFEVLCDGQWTVVQRRFGGSEIFYRNCSDYRDGFGSVQGEFFLGLEKLHRMTTTLSYELYIELVDFSGEFRHACYDSFQIGCEKEEYKLRSLGKYSGTAGNALDYNLHDKFTTFDRDNDGWQKGNCANYYSSGWWYNFHGNR